MDAIVASVGGSIVVPGDDDAPFIKELAAMLLRVAESHKLYVVVGGGKVARYYIRTGRQLVQDEKFLDEMGIGATRLNARLLAAALGGSANKSVPETIETAADVGKDYAIVIMGGTVPGHTTDAVSAMLAEKVGAARLVNATSVDGVYTADPNKDPGATKMPRLTFQELIDIVGTEHGEAGPNVVIDPVAAGIIARIKLPTYVVKGRDLKEFENALLGKEFIGTIIDG